ncbi:MAG: DNA topoisomerase [Acutalibacteraceae bacterium]|nr:DNA topoisomerase [Acutalibacteraceae bacterium]
MKRALLIAEKPSLMRTIKETYDKTSCLDYTITKFTAQAGHLVRLLLPSELDEEQKKWAWENLPFFPEEHGGWKYRIIEGKSKLFNEIKQEVNSGNYDFIIHAGDPDSEGQLLVQLVLNQCKNKLPVKRFWSNDLTPRAIEHALKNLKDNDNDKFLINLYEAALTRQKMDYLYGMNFSQAISLKTNQTMSIGRVKTPVTKIIVDRENEIANFKPTTTYEVSVDYKQGFSGVLVNEQGNVSFADKKAAERLTEALNSIGEVVSIESKEEKTNPPAYFKLSTLQIAAGKAFGYNADKVLSIVQSLYEKKVMSYPRTSCEFLSSATDFKALLSSASVIPELVPYIKKITDDDIRAIQANKRYCNDKKLQEAGHSALTLTEIAPKTLTTEEMNIYAMVAKQLVASFLPPLVENKTVVMTKVDDKMFKSTGKVLVSAGFTTLLGKVKDKDDEDKSLPVLKEKQKVNVDKFNVNEKTTICPKHYSDADLIALMENPSKFLKDKSLKDKLSGKLKIGTEATRAKEITDICGRTGYAEKRKGKGKSELIYALPKSIGLIERIKDFDIAAVDMTAQMEYKLELIRNGELNPKEVIEDVKRDIVKQLKTIQSGNITTVTTKKIIGKCPGCGGNMVLGEKSVFCSNWKEKGCKNGFLRNILGAKITDNEIEKLLSGQIITKTLKKDDKSWKQKLKLSSDFKLEFVKENNILPDVECPFCGSSIKITDKYYICENYKKPDCSFIIGKDFFGVNITEKDAIALIQGKRVKKKLKSKAGNDYEEYLVLREGKVKVEYK